MVRRLPLSLVFSLYADPTPAKLVTDDGVSRWWRALSEANGRRTSHSYVLRVSVDDRFLQTQRCPVISTPHSELQLTMHIHVSARPMFAVPMHVPRLRDDALRA